MHRLFVYGSLKRGFSNHHFLQGQTFLGEARTLPVYRMFDYGGFPALVSATADGMAIEGEIWQIDGACLAKIDELECVDHGLYERTTAKLAPPHHKLEGAILYRYLRDVSRLPDAGVVWEPTRELKNPG